MKFTLIAAYDHYPKADSAYNDLLAHGFRRSALRVVPAEATYEGRQAALRKLDQAADLASDSLNLPDFFKTLFGDQQQEENADLYLEAVRRGAYLVIVNADREEERDRALEIMQNYHPLKLEERETQWRSLGWTKYDISSPILTDPDLGHESTLYTEERPTLPIAETQGNPKGASMYDRDGRLPASSVRIYQHGFRGF